MQAMRRSMTVVGCVVLVGGVVFMPRTAAAQGRAGDVRPLVGAGVGLSSFPKEFQGCGDAAAIAPGAELRAGVRLGPSWSVLSRVSAAASFAGAACTQTIQTLPDGTHTVRRFAHGLGDNGIATADLRVAYSLPSWPYLRAAAGAGWAWDGKRLPFLVGGFAARGAGRWAPFVEAEGWFFRAPVRVESQTWERGSLVDARLLARAHEWLRTFSLRSGVELTL